MVKRAREGDEETSLQEVVPVDVIHTDGAEPAAARPASSPEDDEDDQPLHKNFRMSTAVRTGGDCPYLDTISRQVGPDGMPRGSYRVCLPLQGHMRLQCLPSTPPSVHLPIAQNLDFDFEKCCSVSLSPVNVYACLVCGKYFQVRRCP